MAKTKGVTFIPGVVFGKKGQQITSLEDALAEDAQCKCGVDCCNGTITLIDPETKEQVVLTAAQITALLALLEE